LNRRRVVVLYSAQGLRRGSAEEVPVPDSFGARLRRKREEQQIALSAVAADTKIKLSLLEGLERDDVSGWPAGIFRRAYVRAYARALHLPPDEVVAEFVATYPEVDTSDVPLSASFPKSAEADSWHERIWQFGRRAAQSDTVSSNAAAAIAPAHAPATADARAQEMPFPPERATSASGEMASASVEVPFVEVPSPVVADDRSPDVPIVDSPDLPAFEPALAAVAKVCTDLSQVADANDLVRALEAAAALMNGSGMIVWLWDGSESALVPAFTHGYGPRVLARLSPISHSGDNATAATFRSGEVSVVKRTARQNGALVAPLLRSGGCIGVLAIELLDGVEQISAVGHVARIIAAQMATLFDAPAAGAAVESSPAATG
jgi:transcriptional regulator with XRE-family HTH domain